jgi:hypothetical protein
MIDRSTENGEGQLRAGDSQSQLRQWPIQMHLISPQAPYFQGADVVLTADCVPFAMGNFHGDYLKGRSIGIACPKLDQGMDSYVEKIRGWVDEAKINTLTVMIMEVPCCMGLLQMAKQAMQSAARKAPLKCIVVGLNGDVRSEDWIDP